MMQKHITERAFELLNLLIDDAPHALLRNMTSGAGTEQCHILAPRYIIDLCQSHIYKMSPEELSLNEAKFRGINITAGYEHALVFYHEQYSLFQEPTMIHKIALLPGVKQKNGRYDQIILDLKPFLSRYLPDQHISN